MNKLILIGNGFDIANGLKTRYSDFILWYLNEAFKKASNSNNLFEDDLIKFSLSQNYSYYEIDSVDDFLNNKKIFTVQFKSIFIENIIKPILEKRWVDIESEYYSILLSLYKKLEDGNIRSHPTISIALAAHNQCLKSLKERLVEYLSIINSIVVQNNNQIESKLRGLFSETESSDQVNNVLLLNFNYTHTLDNYVDSKSFKNAKILNIHGSIDDLSNPIIFGYGDEMDLNYQRIESLNDNKFLMNMKSFGYFQTTNYLNFLKFVTSDFFEVYIMGHSCGISDRLMLNTIFEHENCKKIQIFYHKISDSANDYFEKTQEISRHFSPSLKGKMREILLPITLCTPLVE